ncbi:hypothetical protein vseg_000738 [Gypsophila vaccaria]
MDSIGFWNIRGMNRGSKQKEINYFLSNNNIDLFGLLETKINNKAMLRAHISFDSWCITTKNGYHGGGRIWILWQPTVFRTHLIEYNAQFIHMRVESLLNKNAFHLTMVYAFNGLQDRSPLWHSLRRLAHMTSGPYAIAGDFNCVLSVTERVGGNVSSSEIEPFRACVEDCGVVDITSVGSRFTWNNKQCPEKRIYSNIDRFLVNKDESDHFPNSYAQFLPEGIYDHTPCIVR